MSDGKVLYEVRADDSKIDADLGAANSKIERGAGKIASGIKSAIAGIGIGYAVKELVRLGAEFEQSMAKASTLFGNAAVDTGALNDKMLALSSSTGVAAEQLGEALYNALSAGIPATDDMGEAMQFLEKSTRLAKAGFTDVDTAMSATVKTINAYGLSVAETDRVQRILMQTQNLGIVTVGELGAVLAQVTPTAAAMGVSIEQVGAAIATMTARGIPAAQATTALNGLIAELGKNGTKGAKALAEATENTKYAGKSFKELMDAGVPLNEVLDLMGQHADASGLSLLDMFSSIEAGRAALSISGEASAAYTKTLEAMGTQVDVVGEAYDKVTNTSGERFNKMMENLKNAGIQLFLAFEPILSALLPPLILLFNELSPIIKELAPLFQAVATIVSGVLKTAFDILMPVIDGLKQTLSGLIKFITGVFSGDWRKAWQGITDIFGGLWRGLVSIVEGVINGIVWAVNKFIDGFNATVGKITGKIERLKTVDLDGSNTPSPYGRGEEGTPIGGRSPEGLAKGSRYIPRDMVEQLHAGESVLTAEETRQLHSMGWLDGVAARLTAAQAGGGGAVYHTTNYAFNSPAALDERAIRQQMILAQQRERLGV